MGHCYLGVIDWLHAWVVNGNYHIQVICICHSSDGAIHVVGWLFVAPGPLCLFIELYSCNLLSSFWDNSASLVVIIINNVLKLVCELENSFCSSKTTNEITGLCFRHYFLEAIGVTNQSLITGIIWKLSFQSLHGKELVACMQILWCASHEWFEVWLRRKQAIKVALAVIRERNHVLIPWREFIVVSMN